MEEEGKEEVEEELSKYELFNLEVFPGLPFLVVNL